MSLLSLRRLVPLHALLAGLAVLAAAPLARAGDNVWWSIGVAPAPGVVVGAGNARPAVVVPQPVYVQPAPVYVQPAPSVYAYPPVTYTPPRVVYTQPQVVYPPQVVYVQPAPAFVPPGHWRHHHGHHRGWEGHGGEGRGWR